MTESQSPFFPTTIAAALPVLAFLASSAGAGLLASWLFDRLRSWLPLPAAAPASRLARVGYALLYVPRYARIVTLLLPQLIIILASLLLAVLTGAPVAGALDVALAAAVGAIVAQLRHGLGLSTELPQ